MSSGNAQVPSGTSEEQLPGRGSSEQADQTGAQQLQQQQPPRPQQRAQEPEQGEALEKGTKQPAENKDQKSQMQAATAGGGGPPQPAANEELTDAQVIDLEEERRRAAIGNMERIEEEFTALKSQFFEQKLSTLDTEIKQLVEGTHEGYLTTLEELQRVKQRKEWQANKWLELQQQSIAILYNAELKQAEDEYQADAGQVRQQLREQLLEQKRRVEEDRQSMTLQAEDTERVVTRTRQLRKRAVSSSTNAAGMHGILGDRAEDGDVLGAQSSEHAAHALSSVHGDTLSTQDAAAAKRLRVAPPHIQYMLNESQISSDLDVIRKASAITYTDAGNGIIEPDVGSVTVVDDKLRVNKDSYDKGSGVIVTSVRGQQYRGTLAATSAAEVSVRGADGSLWTFSLESLRTGANKIAAA